MILREKIPKVGTNIDTRGCNEIKPILVEYWKIIQNKKELKTNILLVKWQTDRMCNLLLEG